MSDISNPYRLGEPVVDPAMLFGRQDAADWIDLQITGLNQTLVLSALPLIGKTSFLRHVGTLLSRPTLNLLVSLDNLPVASPKKGKRRTDADEQNLNTVLQSIIDQLLPQLTQHNLLDLPAQAPSAPQMASALRELFAQANKHLPPEQPLLLFIDDLHLLVTEDKALVASFLTSLMPLLDECPSLHLIFTVNQGPLKEIRHPLLDGAPTYNLGPLSADAAINMITLPVKDVLRFDYGVTKRISEVNSNHPYYLNLYCHTLLNRQVHDGWVNQQDFDNTLVDILDSPIEPFARIWEKSSDAERAVLTGMAAIQGAHGPIIDREIIRYMQNVNQAVTADVVMDALRSLAHRGVLVPMGAVSYRFHVEMLRFWLRTHTNPSEMISQVNWGRAASQLEANQKAAASASAHSSPRYRPMVRQSKPSRGRWVATFIFSLVLLCMVAFITVIFAAQFVGIPLTALWQQSDPDQPSAAGTTADGEEILPLGNTAEPVAETPTPAGPTPTPSPTPALVVARTLPSITYMARDIDKNWRVYLMDADGANPTAITPEGEGDDTSPVWSPDGQKIAFVSRRDGNREIYVMDADGQNIANVTRHPADDWTPAWSPDGSRLAFSSFRDGGWEIYVMDTACFSEPESCVDSLTQITSDGNGNLSPVYSPDGSRFAFNSKANGNWDVYTMAINGTDVRQVTTSPDNDLAPAWSPDGSLIAFESNRDGNVEVYIIGANGGEARNITNQSQANEHGPTWSPDGQQLVFYSNREGNWDIFVTTINGSPVTNITNTPTRDEQTPTWRP